MTTKKFGDLREDLFRRSPPSRERVAEQVERLSEQLGLAELRSLRSRTQTELAKFIGTTQSAVSRIERQQDLLVSTLQEYVAATGGRLRIVAEYADYEVDVGLPVIRAATEPTGSRSFRVIWQNLQSRQLVHVGWLVASVDRYLFSYTPEAEIDQDFEPFPPFPDLRRQYESDQLFAFFADRVAGSARGDVDEVRAALGLGPQEATPVELLARTWGRTPHDMIQVVPEPDEITNGTWVRRFLVSGARHVDEDDPERVARLISELRPGQPLTWFEEPLNPVNDRAVRLECDGQQVGWMPDYLLDELHKVKEMSIRIAVEHANGADAPWHLRLLCRLETSHTQANAE